MRAQHIIMIVIHTTVINIITMMCKIYKIYLQKKQQIKLDYTKHESVNTKIEEQVIESLQTKYYKSYK